MCRALIYLGQQSIKADQLLFAPDNSLIKQAYDPKQMKHIQNLAGFGMAAWSYADEKPEEPYFYKTHELPFFDKNLYYLAKKISGNCFLAHVRGVAYSSEEEVVDTNAHPFIFNGYRIALAHNGNLADLYLMKPMLLEIIGAKHATLIDGNTDSEWIYALFVSLLKNPLQYVPLEEAMDALEETLKILRELRKKLEIDRTSPINLFLTNGEYAIVTRFVYDFGHNVGKIDKAHMKYHSLWYSFGETYGCYDGIYKIVGSKKRNNIIFASEPLTVDLTTWIEVPEYSITFARFKDGEIDVHTKDICI